MRAVIAAGAPFSATPLVRAALDKVDLLIAADSGAETLLALGLRPDLVIGDMDSISGPALRKVRSEGIAIETFPSNKDLTDTHLALLAAIERGASDVTILGALGGKRPDHGFANVLLLGHEEFAHLRLAIVDGSSEMRAVRESLSLHGEPGDYISLLALTDEVAGIESMGLEYPLAAATLRRGDSRGISNRLIATEATIDVGKGVLLVVQQHGSEKK